MDPIQAAHQVTNEYRAGNNPSRVDPSNNPAFDTWFRKLIDQKLPTAKNADPKF